MCRSEIEDVPASVAAALSEGDTDERPILLDDNNTLIESLSTSECNGI